MRSSGRLRYCDSQLDQELERGWCQVDCAGGGPGVKIVSGPWLAIGSAWVGRGGLRVLWLASAHFCSRETDSCGLATFLEHSKSKLDISCSENCDRNMRSRPSDVSLGHGTIVNSQESRISVSPSLTPVDDPAGVQFMMKQVCANCSFPSFRVCPVRAL